MIFFKKKELRYRIEIYKLAFSSVNLITMMLSN